MTPAPQATPEPQVTQVPLGDGTVQDIAAGELLITGPADDAAVTAAVQAHGGTIIERDPRITLYRARFPVESVDELQLIRDRLRADGVAATFNAMIDPQDFDEEP